MPLADATGPEISAGRECRNIGRRSSFALNGHDAGGIIRVFVLRFMGR